MTSRSSLMRIPFLLAALLCLTPAGRGGDALGYELLLRLDDPASERVDAEALISGLRGPVTLSLPESYAYARVAPRLVSAPVLVGGDGVETPLVATSGTSWRLDAGESVDARVRWSVIVDHRRDPAVAGRDEYEHPYVAEDHAMLVAGALIVAPDTSEIDARVRFALPAGWPVHAPWPEVEPGVFAPDATELRDDVVAVGAWELVAGDADGLAYTVAFAPGQEALAEMALPRLPRILEAEVALFGGAPQSHYLFLFGRPDTSSGYGGSPKTNAMTLFVSPDLPVDFAAGGVTHLIAHEFHHTWMKARCEPEDELRFIIEGFTDWYAHVVPWRLGLVDDAAFLASLEGKLSEAETDLTRFGDSLLASGGPEFFEGGDAYRACYAGGLGMALLTDLALREAGEAEGLDEAMRAFYNRDDWSPTHRPGLDDWEDLLDQRAGAAFAASQREAVNAARGPDWIAQLDALGVSADRDHEPMTGGPRANFDDTTITALDPQGAGAAVGLRKGDRLLQINGVDVSSTGDVYRAWDAADGGWLVVSYERDGEVMTLESEAPTRVRYRLPWSLLDRLRSPQG